MTSYIQRQGLLQSHIKTDRNVTIHIRGALPAAAAVSKEGVPDHLQAELAGEALELD